MRVIVLALLTLCTAVVVIVPGGGHGLAYGAAGAWYLLVPPSQAEGCQPRPTGPVHPGPSDCFSRRFGPAFYVPLRRWRVDRAFDSAAACEQHRAQLFGYWERAAEDARRTGAQLKDDDVSSEMALRYLFARCLPGEVLSAPPRWYVAVPPHPLTNEAPLRQWQVEEGYYFSGDFEHAAQARRKTGEAQKERERMAEERRQLAEKALEQAEKALEQDKSPEKSLEKTFLEILAIQAKALAEVSTRLAREWAPGRFARCWPREAFPPDTLLGK